MAASWHTASKACIAWGVQEDSGPPQLIETTEGLRCVSCTASEIAWRKPSSVLGAKYTAIAALGAIAPATSISNITSPFASLVGPVGSFFPPSTDISITCGGGSPGFVKYWMRSGG